MAIQFIQGTGTYSTSGVASIAIAFVSNVTAGNAIITTGGTYNTDPTGGFTDSLLNSYTNNIERQSTQAIVIASALNISGGACTVTYTPAGSDYLSITVAEFSGVSTSGALEDSDSAAGATATTISTPALTLTNARLVVIGLTSYRSGGMGALTHTNYTDINEFTTGSYLSYGAHYRIFTSGGDETPTYSWINSVSTVVMAAACYKPAAGETVDMWHPSIEQPYKEKLEVVGY